MKAILAAIDFSPVSDLVVREAAALARALRGKLVLLTVLVEPVYVQGFAPPQKTIARITVTNEQAVRRRLTAMQQALQSELVPVETVVRRGNAAYHIMEEAAEHDARFIVIGSHGHTAFFDLILGGTSQTVLKQARLPVVVIPPKMRKPRKSKRMIASTPIRK
jgi:nucleotide-binding universal stress UspA family protein